MLDIKFIRENLETVKKGLERRNGTRPDLESLLNQEDERRQGLQESEQLKNKKKKLSAEVGRLKQQGEDASQQMEEVKNLNVSIKELDDKVEELASSIHEKLLGIPNLPDKSIPDGQDESGNRFIRDWGSKPEITKPLNHVEIGEKLGLLDMKRAAKISGARFAVYRGGGAALLRGLINFMVDVQTQENGYEELYPPFLVNEESLLGTGQLPKFGEELFTMRDDPLFLIPTAEVPVTNFHRSEILEEEALPICYTAYTPCFRREAGSYGKDTQGLIRQHQFDKVELVKFCKASESGQELEKLLVDAESILKKLDLHYRVMELCVGDLGFSSTKTYDLEVWLPSQNTYREISSCSNFTDYQARRAKIRCKKKTGGKPEFVHTLNGSGLAAGRLFVAILENYQNEDGTVTVPEAIRPYLKGREVLS
ncbi:MAG: serine--tRNA ligase [Nitrospinota bacterium]